MTASIVFCHLELHLSPLNFHSFFQVKIGEPSIFYFTARLDYQFLRKFPSSNKGLKDLFFYACLPDPLLEIVQWITELPRLLDF